MRPYVGKWESALSGKGRKWESALSGKGCKWESALRGNGGKWESALSGKGAKRESPKWEHLLSAVALGLVRVEVQLMACAGAQTPSAYSEHSCGYCKYSRGYCEYPRPPEQCGRRCVHHSATVASFTAGKSPHASPCSSASTYAESPRVPRMSTP